MPLLCYTRTCPPLVSDPSLSVSDPATPTHPHSPSPLHPSPPPLAQAIAGVKATAAPVGPMQAFVFIKPHAVTPAVQALARSKLEAAGSAQLI